MFTLGIIAFVKKSKTYQRVFFGPDVLRAASKKLAELAQLKPDEKLYDPYAMRVNIGSESWTHDSIEEFFADYRQVPEHAAFGRKAGEIVLDVEWREWAQSVRSVLTASIYRSSGRPARRCSAPA